MFKILLVDDDHQILAMLTRYFTAADFEVATASDGLEGMEKAKAFNPDLILADVAMPNLDGVGFCALIKKNPRTSHIPFLFLSGDDHIGKVEEALKLGGDGYVHKPFDLKRLMEKVQTLIDRKPLPPQA